MIFRSAPFGSMSPVLVAGLGADGIALAPSGLSAIISSKSGASYDLYSVTRGSVSDPFGTPVALTSVNGASDDEGTLFFSSSRGSGTNLYVSTASNGVFAQPTLLAVVNSSI